ncbi:MAG: pentapeptide repeat-containing protein, partial [Nocardioides sp.]
MPEPSPYAGEGRDYRDEDWYAEDLGAAVFVGCTFTEVDLTEATTSGARFESCTFHRCRFNSSTHQTSAFVACDFRRCSFFDATFDGCKLTGSVFGECTMRPVRIVGGQWRGVTIRGTNLTKLDLAG